MKDFKKNFMDGLSKTSQFLKESSEEAVNKIKEGAEKLSAAGPVAKEKVIEVVNDVLAVLPILEQVGYRTNEFKIGMSIAPVIEISFSRFLNVSEEEIEKIKKEQEEKTMFNMILSMLETANSISGKLETDNFDFHETIVEISVPPKVSLRYVNKDLKKTEIHLLGDDE